MPIWLIEDDCLAPERLRIDYTGPNPFKICLALRSMLERIFEVEAVDLWERDFRWDTTGDPRGFYMRMEVSKGIDAKTSIFIEVTMQGQQPSDPAKNGKVTVYIYGKIVTRYDMESVFQRLPMYKFFIWLYHYIFYNEVRRGYIRWCKDHSEILWREIREMFGLPPPEGAA